jgi:hypothetical protein
LKTLKPRKLGKSPFASNNGAIVLCLVFAIIITVPISIALAASVRSPNDATLLSTPQVEIASPQTQVEVHIAYAYVGPAPSNVSSYLENSTNSTMHLSTQYPATVRLNITRLSGVQIPDCDAVIEVYGVKIAADTGATEWNAYFVGTNYAPSFTNDSALSQFVIDLVNLNQYGTVSGNFVLNWTSNTSIVTNSIGSITKYVSTPIISQGLFSLGKPNEVLATVYRIGYVTITNGSVTVHADPSKITPRDMVQLSNYENGFLHNDIVPSTQLPQINLFQPIAHP